MKRQRLINAILLVLCIAATALFVVRITGKEESPVYEPSLTYRIYSPRTDVRVAFVKDFAIDSFKIDVTVITAIDSAGWEWMRKAYERSCRSWRANMTSGSGDSC